MFAILQMPAKPARRAPVFSRRVIVATRIVTVSKAMVARSTQVAICPIVVRAGLRAPTPTVQPPVARGSALRRAARSMTIAMGTQVTVARHLLRTFQIAAPAEHPVLSTMLLSLVRLALVPSIRAISGLPIVTT